MHTISSTVERKFIDSLELSDLEIETDEGWQPISQIHKTIEYDVYRLVTSSGLFLECADDHILFDKNNNEIFVKNIIPNVTEILTINGFELVTHLSHNNIKENMYDVTVDHPNHRFYTNGILSHNTTIVNALSYALFGQAISDIKVNNLINKTNEKNMVVTVDFSINNIDYRIERGRKPNILKFYNLADNNENIEGEQQGENKDTQNEINATLGISHSMFKHTVALNTYTIPFLAERAGDQRAIIEELLGITVLTEKAELLKQANKFTKDQIKEEEFKVQALTRANDHIKDQIKGLKNRQKVWQNKHDATLNELSSAISTLMEVDIEKEIKSHEQNTNEINRIKHENAEAEAAISSRNHELKIAANEAQAKLNTWNLQTKECNRWIATMQNDIEGFKRQVQGLEKDIQYLNDHKCHACGQDLHDEKQEENKKAKELDLLQTSMKIVEAEGLIEEQKLKLAELGPIPIVKKIILESVNLQKPNLLDTFYESINDAYNHKSSLETLTKQLENALEEQDPYNDQIIEMEEKGLQEINFDEINRLNEMQEHQAFLLKLLTNKDSFIRKKIIEQNLSYLNNRLTYYLIEIGLPHQVRFMADLSVEISYLGRPLDFDNLSRGERNRLILSLSWAFRDVWESLYSHINLLFVDELIDNGLDTDGVEASIKILKRMARERGKCVWLVSHREELISRVHNIVKVIKENGFTTIENSSE